MLGVYVIAHPFIIIQANRDIEEIQIPGLYCLRCIFYGIVYLVYGGHNGSIFAKIEEERLKVEQEKWKEQEKYRQLAEHNRKKAEFRKMLAEVQKENGLIARDLLNVEETE